MTTATSTPSADAESIVKCALRSCLDMAELVVYVVVAGQMKHRCLCPHHQLDAMRNGAHATDYAPAADVRRYDAPYVEPPTKPRPVHEDDADIVPEPGSAADPRLVPGRRRPRVTDLEREWPAVEIRVVAPDPAPELTPAPAPEPEPTITADEFNRQREKLLRACGFSGPIPALVGIDTPTKRAAWLANAAKTVPADAFTDTPAITPARARFLARKAEEDAAWEKVRATLPTPAPEPAPVEPDSVDACVTTPEPVPDPVPEPAPVPEPVGLEERRAEPVRFRDPTSPLDRALAANRTPRSPVAPKCIVPSCQSKNAARGWCGLHYARAKTVGLLNEAGVTVTPARAAEIMALWEKRPHVKTTHPAHGPYAKAPPSPSPTPRTTLVPESTTPPPEAAPVAWFPPVIVPTVRTPPAAIPFPAPPVRPAPRLCRWPGCTLKREGLGLCKTHYGRAAVLSMKPTREQIEAEDDTHYVALAAAWDRRPKLGHGGRPARVDIAKLDAQRDGTRVPLPVPEPAPAPAPDSAPIPPEGVVGGDLAAPGDDALPRVLRVIQMECAALRLAVAGVEAEHAATRAASVQAIADLVTACTRIEATADAAYARAGTVPVPVPVADATPFRATPKGRAIKRLLRTLATMPEVEAQDAMVSSVLILLELDDGTVDDVVPARRAPVDVL